METRSGTGPSGSPLAADVTTSLVKSMQQKFGDSLFFLGLTGSRAAGLALPGADIDLIAVVEGSTGQSGRGYEHISDYAGSTLVETTVYSRAQFERELALASSGDFSGLNNPQVARLDKLVSCHPLHKPDNWRELLKPFRKNSYEKGLKLFYLREITNTFDDVAAAFAAQDYFLAFQAQSTMLDAAAEYLLCNQGDTYGRRKWQMKRLERLNSVPDALKAMFFQATFCSDFSSDLAMRRTLEWRFRFVQVALAYVVACENFSDNGDAIVSGEGQIYQTAPVIQPIRFASKLFIKDQAGKYGVNQAVFDVLSFCSVPRRESEVHLCGQKLQQTADYSETDISEILQALRLSGHLIHIDRGDAIAFFDKLEESAKQMVSCQTSAWSL